MLLQGVAPRINYENYELGKFMVLSISGFCALSRKITNYYFLLDRSRSLPYYSGEKLHSSKGRAFYMKGASLIRNLILIAFLIGLISGCRTMSPPRFYALSDEPMRNSSPSGYLELQDVYDSDGQIFVMGWADVEKEGTYVMELTMVGPKGEQIFTNKRDAKSDTYQGQPYVYFGTKIHLDQDLIAKLSPGNITIHISCDGKPLVTKQIKYTPGSIINQNVNQVVVLPFYSSTNSTFTYDSKDWTLNTLAYAVTNEIKRIAKDVIPHYVAEQKLSDKIPKKCFDNVSCRDRLKEVFGEAIIIEGDADIPKYTDDPRTLKISVYNTKTGDVKEFRYTTICVEGGYRSDCIRDLLKTVLYKSGLLAYIRGL
jgi:hypothetical protein